MTLLQQRKWVNRIVLFLSMAAMVFGLFWLAWILVTVFDLGVSGLSLQLFTKMTPPPGASEAGGLLNAIAGSLTLVTLATLLGTPIGILAGIYLAEYGQITWLGRATRFINDILLSAPSIVIGLFVYAIYVAQVGKFSAISGIIALALLVIPVVVSTTENMLKLVPSTLREAAFGDPACDPASLGNRCDYRRSAGGGPHLRRNSAPALYRSVQPVLEHGSQRAHGQSAGDHFQVRHESIQGLAGTGLGRCIPDNPWCARPEHHHPADLYGQEQPLIRLIAHE